MGDFVDESADGLDMLIRGLRAPYDSKPRTSDILWPSFLFESLICPMEFMKCTPVIHSSTESSTSRAKSWRCLISELSTSLSRSPVLGPMVSMTWLVKLGSNLEAGLDAIVNERYVNRVD